jgi:elongation factor 1-beta
MVKLEEAVRSIQKDGLVWGSSKLVAIGFGIKNTLVVGQFFNTNFICSDPQLIIYFGTEDEKISTDELQEEIAEFDDYVQSTDVAAMQSESGLICPSWAPSE